MNHVFYSTGSSVDLFIFAAVFFVFLAFSFFRFFSVLLRVAIAFPFAFAMANMFLVSAPFKHLPIHFGQYNLLVVFAVFFALFMFAFRKINFNYNYTSKLSRVLLSAYLSFALLLFVTAIFSPNLLVYNWFANYQDFILSANYALLIYGLLLLLLLII